MASCSIQIGNPEVLKKIESFLNDSSYRDAIENSSNYNSRLCIERRLRMPFLDSQTGVAQNHSNLFMSSRQRIPGLEVGQIYTYPSKRWRKKRRQYLMNFSQPPRRKEMESETDLHTISTVENPAASEESKDSIPHVPVEQPPKVPEQWYFDELDMHEMEGFDEPDPDSDFDYEESYSSKRKKKRGSPKGARSVESPIVKKPKGPGRGRKKQNYDALTDADKPFSCELCGARYKTRPGLTYHYTHSHKDRDDEESMGVSEGGQSDSRGASSPSGGGQPKPMMHPSGGVLQQQLAAHPQALALPPPQDLVGGGGGAPGWSHFQDSYLTFLNAPGGMTPRRGGRQLPHGGPGPSFAGIHQPMDEPPHLQPMVNVEKPLNEPLPPPQVLTLTEEKERAAPSPYCDFCLGDQNENKKTNQSEELVSCSDCGRSGHPTCLQFTDNMIISVRKYRWQCIECKCCSICGNSDNDDQLLFCDDCDRGYHMYCLAPPLTTPPEGSWSCRLCYDAFHKK